MADIQMIRRGYGAESERKKEHSQRGKRSGREIQIQKATTGARLLISQESGGSRSSLPSVLSASTYLFALRFSLSRTAALPLSRYSFVVVSLIPLSLSPRMLN